jgi:alpha-1,3-rhamnosyl/mannosyltransferase
MRVLFNQWSTAGQRTGVGHVARQLTLHLAQDPAVDLTAYPSERFLQWHRRLELLTNLLQRWRRQSPGALHALAPLGFLRILSRAPRRAYQRYLDRVHREIFFGNQHDLYHEPNFIPFESSLPTITTLHDLSVLLHPEWHPATRVRAYEEHFPRSLEQSTHFITVSEFTRRQTIQHLGIAPERVTAIPNAPRPEFRPLPESIVARLRQRLSLPPRYLLYVGTIEPRKNVLRLMQAYVALPPSVRRECPLLLAGQWGWNIPREREYFESTAKHGGVRHLGYVRDEDLPVLLNGARALVYPSVYEGFGLPPLEMLACGGAVLASKIPPITEVTGQQACLIDPGDTEGWRDALLQVVTDDDWHADLCSGAARFAERFNWHRAAAEHREVYHRVLTCEVAPVRRAA